MSKKTKIMSKLSYSDGDVERRSERHLKPQIGHNIGVRAPIST